MEEKLITDKTFMVALNERMKIAMKWEWISRMTVNERMPESDCK
jgi:hypothetical protein